jgi:hypothetical protein
MDSRLNLSTPSYGRDGKNKYQEKYESVISDIKKYNKESNIIINSNTQ